MGVILALFVSYLALALVHSVTARPQGAVLWKAAWLPFTLLIFLLSATRVGGSDWENYEYLYSYMSNADSWLDAILRNPFFEPGYVALNYVFHSYSEERRLLVVFESAVNAYAIWLILTRVRGGPILLIWLFPLQFANILGVRQTFATSLFIIATVLLHGRKATFAAVLSSLVHLSSLVLTFARATQNLVISWRNALIGLVSLAVCALATRSFLADKLTNYQENSADITDISGTEILLGKSLTILVLFAVDAFARRQPARLDPAAIGSRQPAALYFFYLAIVAVSVALPPLSRLLTPVELLIAWAACEAVANVRHRTTRIGLTLFIALISAAKMFKITSQLGDIYAVCFFCA